MEFKVKRDFIPIFLINVILLLICACSIVFFLHWTGWLITVLIIDLLVLIIYNSSIIFARCTITEDKLIYQTGMFKYSIPLDKIAKVTKAKNFHVSLAPSIDRIRILVVGETGRQCAYYISVVDSRRLMNAIKPNPELKNVKDEIATPLTEIKEEPKQEIKTEEVTETKEKEAVTTPKTTAKSSSTTKKPAANSTTKKTTAKSTTAKKSTSTSKKSN